MQKAKSITILLLSIFFACFLIKNTYAGYKLTPTERRDYAQNNIIFYLPCDSEDGCKDSETSDDGTTSGTSDDGTPSGGTSIPTTGECACPDGCGVQTAGKKRNANNLFSQGSYSETEMYHVYWRNGEANVSNSIADSGCSVVAIINAANSLGERFTREEVASWSFTRVSGKASWDGSVKTIADHVGLEIVELLFDNKNNKKPAKDVTAKLALIKQALASGMAVIASGQSHAPDGLGDGEYGVNKTCSGWAKYKGVSTDEWADAGHCSFSPNGHYVAIIGVTPDNKLVVANPALGSRSHTGWVFPYENVLKFADIAKAVSLKSSGKTSLISCSSTSTETEKESSEETGEDENTNG